MKRTLFFAACAATLLPLSVSAAEVTDNPRTARVEAFEAVSWVALAASSNGKVYQSEPRASEEAARREARNECENKTGRTCNVTMSVPIAWDIIVVKCANGIYMGGSNEGNAWDYAIGKARRANEFTGSCVQIASY